LASLRGKCDKWCHAGGQVGYLVIFMKVLTLGPREKFEMKL